MFSIACSSWGMFCLLNWSFWLCGVCVVGTVAVVCWGGVLSVCLGMPVICRPCVIDIGIASLGRVGSVSLV